MPNRSHMTPCGCDPRVPRMCPHAARSGIASQLTSCVPNRRLTGALWPPAEPKVEIAVTQAVVAGRQAAWASLVLGNEIYYASQVISTIVVFLCAATVVLYAISASASSARSCSRSTTRVGSPGRAGVAASAGRASARASRASARASRASVRARVRRLARASVSGLKRLVDGPRRRWPIVATGSQQMVILRRQVGLCSMRCASHQISATAPSYTTSP
jgi:hypothetical protein